MNIFIRSLLLISVYFCHLQLIYSNVGEGAHAAFSSVPDIRATLVEAGYLEIPGMYIPNTSIQNSKDEIKRVNGDLVSFGTIDEGMFEYNGNVYSIESVISNSLEIMELDEANTKTDSYYGDNFCGNVTLESFVDFSNDGSNISVFVLPDVFLVKVRSESINKYINIFEVFRLIQETGTDLVTFQYNVDLVAPIYEVSTTNITYASAYAGLAYEIESDNIYNYSYTEAVSSVHRIYEYLKNCWHAFLNTNSEHFIPRECWHPTGSYRVAYYAGFVNKVIDDVYGYFQFQSFIGSVFNPWSMWRDPEEMSDADRQDVENRKLLLKFVERCLYYIHPAGVDELANAFQDNIFEPWLEYFKAGPDVSLDIINSVILDCDAPIPDDWREKIFCFKYDLDEIDSYPGGNPNSTCIDYGDGLDCAYFKGRSILVILEAVSAIAEAKVLFEAGDIVGGVASTHSKVNNFKTSREVIKSGQTPPDKVITDVDTNLDPDFVQLFDSDGNLITAYQSLVEKKAPQSLRKNEAFLTRLANNLSVINSINYLTEEGLVILAENVESWIKYYDVRAALASMNYSEAAGILGGTLEDPYSYLGANYVEELSNAQITAIGQVVGSNTDVAVVAGNLGISETIVQVMKDHMFINEHFVEIDADVYRVGRFNVALEHAQWWLQVADNNSTNAENLKKLIAHEYIEARLMEAGMFYRPWDDINPTNASRYGAHELSINDFWLNFNHWDQALNRIIPPFNLSPDFSNIDEIVDQIKNIEGLE